MTRNSDYFRRRAAEARSAAAVKDRDEDVEVAGQLALAYAALARRRGLGGDAAAVVDPAAASVPDSVPLMLRD